MNASNCLTSNDNETIYTSYDRAGGLLYSVISPIILLLGLFGNTIAFLVLFKLFRKKKATFYLFLAVLSVNDLVVLYSGLLRYWIIHTFGFDIRDENNFICKFQLFVIYTSMQYSAWILVSVTLQRCLVVASPSKYNHLYTPKAASFQLGLIFFILSALNFHYFFTNGIINCSCGSLSDEIFAFEEFYWVWVDLFVLCLIPFVIMLLSNIYFMTTIHTYSKAVNKSNAVISTKIRHSIRIIMRLTCLFLATNLPVSLYLISDSYVEDSEDHVKTLINSICMLIQYAGFALNICLYVSVDPKFISTLRKNARKLESSFRSKTSIRFNRSMSQSTSSRPTGDATSETHTHMQPMTVIG